MAKGDKGPLPIYESRPPEWLAKAHANADLGYIGFHPPRPDQEEEVLTEVNVKTGFSLGLSVPLEIFSAHDAVNTRIGSENALPELEELMNQIFARRAENVPPIPPSSFRLPSRVTLNDSKRQAWFADLANSDVPLSKLGKSVPHGAKGHDLLDLLHTNNVAIPRAVWFLRVFGGNETAGLRNKPNYNPTQYSVEWANVVTSYMKKQLADIALPMAPRPGLNIKQTFKGVLSDTDGRERWISRFSYCLDLLRSFYSEGLVDNRTFLAWLVQQTTTCNLAQLGFVARLADEFLTGMLICRALTRPFVEGCLNRLSEIRAASTREYLVNLEAMLKNLVMRVLLALPDALVSPRIWLQHNALLSEILSEHIDGGILNPTQQNTQALRQMFVDSFADVKKRNQAMLFQDLPLRMPGCLSSALSDIKLLNSLSGKSDIESVGFLDAVSEESPAFTSKLDILLTWSVTPLQYGDHRPYAAAGMLHCWRDKAGERAIRRDRASPDEFIQDQLFDWLDSCEIAAEVENLPSVALLYGQLVHHGLFSYEQYIQRLIARGEQGLSFSEENGSRHRNFLRWIPLRSSSLALISQRRVTLYGVRARETPEDSNEREIRKEIRALLPELFGGDPLPLSSFTDGLETSCKALYSAPRYEQVRVVRGWLLPILKKNIANNEESVLSGADNPIMRAYCVSTVLMAHCKCYAVILEITIFTLEHASTTELLTAVIETIRQHMEIWACLNSMKTLTASLYAAYQYWKARGPRNRNLFDLLVEVDNGRYLEPAAREQVLSDRTAYIHALHPTNEVPDAVPAALPEILLLATDPKLEAPSVLANSLWYKYRTASDWAWKVWDNTVASLRQIPSIISDVLGRRECALRYASFLTHIDQYLPAGLDEQILSWLLGIGKNEVAALTADAWDVLNVVLLYLCIHGALSTTTILEGLIYPVWQLGSIASSVQTGTSLEVFLTAINDLCTRLLVTQACGKGFPPANFFEFRGLQTRRRDVYREPHFSSLVENIPTLVLVERNPNLPDSLRQASLTLRQAICSRSVFRQGIYRDLDTVHRSFEKILEDRDISEDLHEPLVDALRLMLNEGCEGGCPVDSPEWKGLSSFLSPWKLAATSIEMRFSLKQLDAAMAHESTRQKSRKYLDQLIATVFHHDLTSEEGDFVAEMMREISAPIASKFVNVGLLRITEVLNENSEVSDADDSNRLVSTAGEVLRLLANVAEPLRDNPSSMPQLDSIVQDDLISAILAKLNSLCTILVAENAGPETEIAITRISHATIFLARVIQFDLGFPGAWTPHTKVLSEQLCSVLMQLAVNFGSGAAFDALAFPLIIDTLYYVLDELPTDPKATAFDPFRNYPQLELQSLPRDMPTEYRKQIRSLLPYVSPNIAVAGLAYTSRDASGEQIFVPVQNKPWEWTEYLGDHPIPEAKSEEKSQEERVTVRNSASIPLELFGTRATGERVLPLNSNDTDPRVIGNLRLFQDDLNSTTLFEREWRETRIALDNPINSSSTERAEQQDQVGPLPTFSHMQQSSSDRRSSSSRKPSPASSVRSRGSVQHGASASVSSLRQSPLFNRLSGSTAGDAIDVDSLDVSTSTSHGTSKRKGMSSTVDEDEVQVVEGPVPKKAKGKGTSKARTKKTR